MSTAERANSAEQANERAVRANEQAEEGMTQFSTRQFHTISTQCALTGKDSMAKNIRRAFVLCFVYNEPTPTHSLSLSLFHDMHRSAQTALRLECNLLFGSHFILRWSIIAGWHFLVGARFLI